MTFFVGLLTYLFPSEKIYSVLSCSLMRIAARQEKVGMPGVPFLLQTLKYTRKGSQTVQVCSIQLKIGESKISSNWESSLLSQVLKSVLLTF